MDGSRHEKSAPLQYEPRTYRELFKGANLVFFNVCIYETDLRIGANMNLYDEAYQLAKEYRQQIEAYIRLYPEFLTSLAPVRAQPGASSVIERMCEAAEKAGVGPMSAVAGAISEMVGTGLLQYSGDIVVENGGDIFLKTETIRKVGIYAGKSPFSERIALEILPGKTPLGICTSSGTVGHSLSFGKADAAVVVSPDVFLADAAATAVGNLVKTAGDIEKALDFASAIPGVSGAVVVIGEKIGAIGDVKLAAF